MKCGNGNRYFSLFVAVIFFVPLHKTHRMTYRISILLLFLFLLKYSASVSGQEAVVFSGETGKYPEELSLYIQKNINAESESVLNEFLTAWSGDSIFNAREQEKIVKPHWTCSEKMPNLTLISRITSNALF